MNNHDLELYIPVNTLDSDDFISGIGSKELTIIISVLFGVLIIAVLIVAFTSNIFVSVVVCIGCIGLTIISIRRDIYNESLITKLKVIYRFYKAQKIFEYKYHNIYED